MAMPLRKKRFYEFGPFRLDASIPVLLRNGDIVPLTPKALDTLVLLVENAGNVVEKETLIQTVWPSAVVEESNVSQHIYTLRKALGDGVGSAVHIETVPKRGYRLIGMIMEAPEETNGRDAPSSVAPRPDSIDSKACATESYSSGQPILQQRRLVLAAAVAACLAVLVAALRLNERSISEGPQWKERQLTANTEQDPVLRSAISPDGKYLAYSDRAGIHVLVTETGESQLLRSPGNLCFR